MLGVIFIKKNEAGIVIFSIDRVNINLISKRIEHHKGTTNYEEVDNLAKKILENMQL